MLITTGIGTRWIDVKALSGRSERIGFVLPQGDVDREVKRGEINIVAGQHFANRQQGFVGNVARDQTDPDARCRKKGTDQAGHTGIKFCITAVYIGQGGQNIFATALA